MSQSTAARFRSLLKSGQSLVGTFVKTPAAEIIEIMNLAGVDFICLDAEHSAMDRRELDWCLALARSNGLPTLVRVSHAAPHTLLQVLDGGASGLLVPHVRNANQAQDVARQSRFGADGRGYAGSTRQGDFTMRGMTDFLEQAASEVTVVVQIEDPEAVEDATAIAAVPGVDGVFFGAADLGVGLGIGASKGPEIDVAFLRVQMAAKAAGIALGAYCAAPSALTDLRQKGVQLAIVGSDQSMILAGARALSAAK